MVEQEKNPKGQAPKLHGPGTDPVAEARQISPEQEAELQELWERQFEAAKLEQDKNLQAKLDDANLCRFIGGAFSGLLANPATDDRTATEIADQALIFGCTLAQRKAELEKRVPKKGGSLLDELVADAEAKEKARAQLSELARKKADAVPPPAGLDLYASPEPPANVVPMPPQTTKGHRTVAIPREHVHVDYNEADGLPTSCKLWERGYEYQFALVATREADTEGGAA